MCMYVDSSFVHMYVCRKAMYVGIHTYIATRNETESGQLGQLGHMFCLSQPDLARFVKYPGLTLYWITCVINGVWT